MSPLDFAGLNQRLLSNARDLLPQWLPGGRMHGREYVCAGLGGGKGESLSVNVDTGRWADFADPTLKGGDLISLYAAIQGIGQGDAFKQLDDGHSLPPRALPAPTAPNPPAPRLGPPPADAPEPSALRGAESFWVYRQPDGTPWFYVARFPGKQIRPLAWDLDALAWVPKSLPRPRPLYGLELLAGTPAGPVLIVEGEKAAEAARVIAGHVYTVVTWPNGASGHAAADWTPLHGRRKVLIWPDADEPGRAAAQAIADRLGPHCAEVKVIDPTTDDPAGLPQGWDAADALAEGWDWGRFVTWVRPRLTVWVAPTPTIPPAPTEPPKTTLAAPVQVLKPTPVASPPTARVEVTVTEDQGIIDQSLAVKYATYGIAVTGRAGAPIVNMENSIRVLNNVPAFRSTVWWDEFHGRLFHQPDPDQPAREWTDADTLALLARLQGPELGFQKLSDTTLYQALVVYGRQHARNEPRDWMDSLTWDGTPRVEAFFHDAFGAEDNDYTRAASRNWWITMAARVYRPGCKVDTMVIFEGAQGAGKSQALSIIGGPWFAEATESVTSKDFFLCLAGKLILEISELDAFNRAEANRIKQVITAQVDRYRTPYGRLAEDNPRKCIFVGTTNDSNYLRDNTGGRRFWPIEVGEIRLDLIRENREQLFAEAVHLFKQGATWHEMPAQAAVEQEARRQHDEWEHTVAEYLDQHRADGVTIKEVWTDCLGQTSIKDLDGRTQWRIIHILQALRWKVRVVWKAGKATRVYFPIDPF